MRFGEHTRSESRCCMFQVRERIRAAVARRWSSILPTACPTPPPLSPCPAQTSVPLPRSGIAPTSFPHPSAHIPPSARCATLCPLRALPLPSPPAHLCNSHHVLSFPP